jgi:hypothetical protein
MYEFFGPVMLTHTELLFGLDTVRFLGTIAEAVAGRQSGAANKQQDTIGKITVNSKLVKTSLRFIN